MCTCALSTVGRSGICRRFTGLTTSTTGTVAFYVPAAACEPHHRATMWRGALCKALTYTSLMAYGSAVDSELPAGFWNDGVDVIEQMQHTLKSNGLPTDYTYSYEQMPLPPPPAPPPPPPPHPPPPPAHITLCSNGCPMASELDGEPTAILTHASLVQTDAIPCAKCQPVYLISSY